MDIRYNYIARALHRDFHTGTKKRSYQKGPKACPVQRIPAFPSTGDTSAQGRCGLARTSDHGRLCRVYDRLSSPMHGTDTVKGIT